MIQTSCAIFPDCTTHFVSTCLCQHFFFLNLILNYYSNKQKKVIETQTETPRPDKLQPNYTQKCWLVGGEKKKKCISNDQRATLDRTKFIFLKSSIFLREPVSKSRRPNHFPLQSVLSTAAPPPSLPLYSLSDDELLWIFSIKSSAILETSLPASWVGCPLLE